MISNALKFTEKGGIILTAKFNDQTNNMIKITVADSGRGIKEED